MSYKKQLEHLLAIAVRKANAFLDFVRSEGQTNSPDYQKAEAEWENAEKVYRDFLQQVRAAAPDLNEALPAAEPGIGHTDAAQATPAR